MKILMKIKKIRKEHNLTQKDMAEILGYKTAKGYHDIECGRVKLKFIPLEKFFI